MAKWLTQEWHDETKRLAADQPEREGATTRMQYVINGGPDKQYKYFWVIEEGKLLEATVGDLDEPELTLSMTYDDAMRIQKGELDTQAAFMQGRVKVEGRMEKLMALLPITSSPEYQELQERIREITEY